MARSHGLPLRGDFMATKGAGRKSLYDTKIRPNLDTIEAMARTGITQKKMREILGVSRSTWEKYKSEEKEFSDKLLACKDAPKLDRTEEVKELEESMKKLAHGFFQLQQRYINTKEGPELVEEMVYYPPNFQAIRFLLLNWGGYMSEPVAQAQREKEFQHKKAMDEKNNW